MIAIVPIKAVCHECGEVHLTADEIELRIRGTSQGDTYRFSCPVCGGIVEKPADDQAVRLLLSGGVKPTFIKSSEEALEEHQGPVISHDDLLAFHEMLEGQDWFAELTGHRTS